MLVEMLGFFLMSVLYVVIGIFIVFTAMLVIMAIIGIAGTTYMIIAEWWDGRR